MENKDEVIKRIIDREILTLANELFYKLVDLNPDLYCDFQNLYDPESEEHVEIFQYFIVTDWLADKLIEIEEPVLKDCYGVNFWGRTCFGQAIESDGTIQEILKHMERGES